METCHILPFEVPINVAWKLGSMGNLMNFYSHLQVTDVFFIDKNINNTWVLQVGNFVYP